MARCGLIWALMAVAGLTAAGCGGSQQSTVDDAATSGHDDDHGGHAHADPKTLSEAVAVLTEIRDELAAAYQAANVQAADEAIHEMEPVIRKTKELIAEAGLDRYDQDAAETAVDQLMEVLDALHQPHSADAKLDPATYEGQAERLNEALTSLQTLAEKVPAEE